MVFFCVFPPAGKAIIRMASGEVCFFCDGELQGIYEAAYAQNYKEDFYAGGNRYATTDYSGWILKKDDSNWFIITPTSIDGPYEAIGEPGADFAYYRSGPSDSIDSETREVLCYAAKNRTG